MNADGVIAALVIGQRGAMKKMLGKYKEPTSEDIVEFKKLVSSELTKYTSAILLDPEYGIPATTQRDTSCGLLMAYERTGHDATVSGRLPDLLGHWSARRLQEAGADAVKFLLYYDPDESDEINDQKKAFVERIGAECKLEVPVNMAFVEGFTDEGVAPVYSADEAAGLFKEQAEATNLPFIFLSAGVSAELFRKTPHFAKRAGSTFNGVLCGRATWADGVAAFARGGEQEARAWLEGQGRKNVEELNEVLAETATPIKL